MTAAEVLTLAAQGRFWWYRPFGSTFHATGRYAAPQSGDVYLLEASGEWLSQFGGDWQGVADYLTPFMSRLDEDEA